MSTLVRHDLTDPAIPEGMVRIVRGGSYRFIWPVHLGGWQSLGWQLQPAAGLIAPEPRLPEPQTTALPSQEPALELDVAPPSDANPLLDEVEVEMQPAAASTELQSAPFRADSLSAPLGADSLSAPLGATFQAMTKAQIIEHCSSVYGVELDGSQTKAELIEQAIALETQNALTPAAASGSEPLLQPESDEPLPDELLDDPLI
ncbi:hypothetical protein KBY99_00450 [Cyanobium sp. Maggiore-St4-Cus]|uniref:hypothetical protein n=1 Tax=Cyanobium sp. Maggiore-St4-Cus TaxID=2823717 RepID=UPI0020CDF17F|nr:hypothetical protein [Cyanobium sp. Maggiore-St4-Cus]MCP9787450.1 hypothetical protein [Cyanobium sp. Maggiore-St4-Cus]